MSWRTNPTETTIIPHQISNSICRNAALNLQGTYSVLLCSLQILSSHLVNKLASANGQNISNFGLVSPEHLVPLSCTPLPVVSCIIESLGLVSMWELWLFGCASSMMTSSSQTSPDSKWVYLGCFLPVPSR